jgi:hypothetical protein
MLICTSEMSEVLHGHRRVVALAGALDGLLRAAGWIRYWGVWKPRGKVTMATLSGRDVPVVEATRREQARRHFLQVEDVEAEIRRFEVDVAAVHLRELCDRITADPMRREATRLQALKSASELAGPDASPILRQIALAVVMFSLESDLASARLLAAAETWAAPPVALLRWRAGAELRLNAKLKTLAYVRHLEESSLQASLSRLRLAAAG